MKKRIVYILVSVFQIVYAQKPVPAPEQSQSIRIDHVTIHVGNGTIVSDGMVGFVNGKIDLVDVSSNKKKYDVTIDGAGKHLYPGFILTNTTLGLNEIDAVRSTLDYDESGNLTPEVRSITSYNTDSKLIPTIRFNGVLVAQSTPRGGLISGQSSIVQLDAWNWEDAAIKTEDGVHINWPNRNQIIYPWQRNTDIYTLMKQRSDAIDQIKDLIQRTVLYIDKTKPLEYNGKCESLKGLFNGSKTLYLHVNTEKDIIESVHFFESVGIKKIVLVGGYEAYKITDFLKEHNLPVILGRIHDLPRNDDDDIKLPYKLPKILWDAGILCTFDHEGDMEIMGSRNLPFNAGTAVAYGLDKEQAVQMITLNAAKILGIDKNLGSIETGKDATFFISEGDALDMMGNNLALAYINGRQIDLKDSQFYLYETYMGKYGLKVK